MGCIPARPCSHDENRDQVVSGLRASNLGLHVPPYVVRLSLPAADAGNEMRSVDLIRQERGVFDLVGHGFSRSATIRSFAVRAS